MKLKDFFERFFGIGKAFKADKTAYDEEKDDLYSMAAEEKSEYKTKK